MKRVSWIILLALVFSLALTACGSSEPEVTVEEPAMQEEPAAQEEDAPSALTEVEPDEEEETAVSEEPAADVEEEAVVELDEPQEEMTEGSDFALSDLQLSSLDELTSYRYTVVMELTAADSTGAETIQTMQMEMAVSTDPPATSMLMTADGTEEMAEMGTMEFVQIEDTAYMNMGELGCMALPADDNSAMPTDELSEGFTPESLTEGLQDLTPVGEETIDGIDVVHYTFDESSMIMEEAAGISTLQGHIYIAKDGGYMVRYIIDVTGDSKFNEGFSTEDFQAETAKTHIEMNLTDVNSAVEIVPPAACEGQQAPETADWPMLEDASAVSSFAGILSYTTEVSGNDAIEFYNNAMAELGFTQDEASSFVSEGNGLLTYLNENDESLTITISEDVDSGLTTVTLLSEAGE
jgi:hypothetical protein